MSAKRRILFLDRDGTLIVEPPDEQIDSLEKFALLDGVIPALLKLRDAGFEFVIVSNQDGLGTASFPRETFEPPQRLMEQVFASQGIRFAAMHFDVHRPADNAPTRKPGIGMLLDYLRAGNLDFEASAVIGDRDTDLDLARNLGVRGLSWARTTSTGRRSRTCWPMRRAPRRSSARPRKPASAWWWTSTARRRPRSRPGSASSTTCWSRSAATAASR